MKTRKLANPSTTYSAGDPLVAIEIAVQDAQTTIAKILRVTFGSMRIFLNIFSSQKLNLQTFRLRLEPTFKSVDKITSWVVTLFTGLN